MMKRWIYFGAVVVGVGALSGCGQSQFAQELTAMCEESGRLPSYDRDCACVIEHLDDGLTDQQKAAFVPLRWALSYDRGEEHLYRQALREAGIDPEDADAVRSARSELNDRLAVLNDEIYDQCPAASS